MRFLPRFTRRATLVARQTAKMRVQLDGVPLAECAGMVRPLRLHVSGMLYHVMARGNGKQQIFLQSADYQRFLDLLREAAERFRVTCCAYCLMPTHYHVILQPTNVSLAPMMQQLNSTYAQHFNRTHQRVGHVFAGRYKSLLVDTDVYFLTLLRYTMRNPVAARLVELPSAWAWSSYKATAGISPAPVFLTLEHVWAHFDATDVARAQRRFVDFVALPDESVPPIDGVFYGSAEFAEQMSPRLEPTRAYRELRYSDRFADRPALAVLLSRARNDAQRMSVVREAFFRYAYTLREIGDAVGYHPGAVWHCLRAAKGARTRRLLKRLATSEAAMTDEKRDLTP